MNALARTRGPYKRVPWAAPERLRCSLLDLTNETCRWPIGDPGETGFYFCGTPSADLAAGQPYCPCHMREAGQ
jgi:GcrA cell cycle regulator